LAREGKEGRWEKGCGTTVLLREGGVEGGGTVKKMGDLGGKRALSAKGGAALKLRANRWPLGGT